MRSDWKQVTLEECTSLLGDGLHGTPKYTESGEYAFVNGNNLVNGKIVIKPETKRIDRTQYEKYRKELNNRTIMVSINGTLGNVAMYNGEKIILGKSACYFNVLESVDKDFIRYVVSSPVFQTYLETNATGTTIKNISLKQMREYSFFIPDYETQKRISGLLRAIDDKIELNNAINKNLEKQAQAIFKSWFVDFEPFGGVMPDDWRTVKIADLEMLITDYVANGSFASLKENVTLYQEPNYAYFIRNTDLKSGSFGVFVDESSYKFLSKSTLYGNEIIISNVGDVGSVFLCPRLDKPMTLGNNIIMLRPKSEYLIYYLYIWFKWGQGQCYIQGIKGGSAQPKFNKTDFKNLPLLFPSFNVLSRFDEVMKSLFETISNNYSENQRLASIRDTLLPKLMNGEIDISAVKV